MKDTKNPVQNERPAEQVASAVPENERTSFMPTVSQESKIVKIVVAVLFVITMIVVMVMMVLHINNSKTEVDQKDKEPTNQPAKPVENDENEDDEANKPVELPFDSELAIKLYNRIGMAASSADLRGFYEDYLQKNEVSNKYLVGIALKNTEPTACKMPKTEENLQERYSEELEKWDWITRDDLAAGYEIGCYDGADIRSWAQTIFGKPATLEMEEFPILGWAYSGEYDEVYSVPGMGSDGFGPGRAYINILYRAEQDDDKIYLYEVIAEQSGPCVTDRNGKDLCMKNYEMNEENYKQLEREIVENKDDFENYKWTFARVLDSEYIFENLEKVEE